MNTYHEITKENVFGFDSGKGLKSLVQYVFKEVAWDKWGLVEQHARLEMVEL